MMILILFRKSVLCVTLCARPLLTLLPLPPPLLPVSPSPPVPPSSCLQVSSKYQTVDTLIQKYVFVPQKFKVFLDLGLICAVFLGGSRAGPNCVPGPAFGTRFHIIVYVCFIYVARYSPFSSFVPA